MRTAKRGSMTGRRLVVTGAVVVMLALAAGATIWIAVEGLPRRADGAAQGVAPTVEAATPSSTGGRRIKAELFYLSEDGMRLTGVEHDVPYADQPNAQAREILLAQVAPVSVPTVSAIPSGTGLRAVFITEGEAFVDLSGEVNSAHPGGTLNELLTIYTIVHSLTANMPAIRSVQVLVDGKEMETLAGHVDLRRPLGPNLEFMSATSGSDSPQ